VHICILAILLVAAIVYNNVYARFLMVGGIDKRLPRAMGTLNRYRSPAGAVLVQTIAALIVTALLLFVIPYIGVIGGQPANVALEAYFVVVGTATIIWAFATIFLFVDLLRLYSLNPKVFRAHGIMPMPLLLFFSCLGLVVGLAAMADTLFFSYIPQLIPNNVWLIIVGLFTAGILIVGAISSMLVSSEAAFQETYTPESRR
jgi:glutamate:GABA antiporter